MVNLASKKLFEFWRKDQTFESIRMHDDIFIEIILYGPLRKEGDTENRSAEILISNLQKHSEIPQF